MIAVGCQMRCLPVHRLIRTVSMAIKIFVAILSFQPLLLIRLLCLLAINHLKATSSALIHLTVSLTTFLT